MDKNMSEEKYRVIDLQSGELIDDNLPKRVAQKMASKKKEWHFTIDNRKHETPDFYKLKEMWKVGDRIKYKSIKTGKWRVRTLKKVLGNGKYELDGGVKAYEKDPDYINLSEHMNESNLLKTKNLSSADYQKAKKLKGFNKDNYKWDPKQDLYVKLDEGTEIDKYDIGVGFLGNGLTVWDRNREKNGDYMTVAHIAENGKITWYDKQLTPKVKKYIMSLHKKVGIGESMKLKDAMKYEINEDLFASLTDPDSGLDEDQKKAFLEAVSGFNRFNESIYREQKLKDITGDIVKIGKLAEKYIMAEQDDWFDGISVKRDMKSLQESIKMFEATAKEVAVLQQRLESVYEEVGGKLGKYFEIHDNELKEDESMTLSDMVKKGQL